MVRRTDGQVLSTDMSKHFHFLGEFKTLLKATHEPESSVIQTDQVDQTYDPTDAIAEVCHIVTIITAPNVLICGTTVSL